MSKNSLKEKLHAIFSRYMRGEATESEEDFVETFYYNLKKYEKKSDVDPEIGRALKTAIDSRLDNPPVYKRASLRRYVRTLAAVLIATLVCGAGYLLLIRDHAPILVQHEVVESPAIAGLRIVKDGASYAMDGTLPEGISVEEIDQEKIIVVSAPSSSGEGKSLRLHNPNRETMALQLSDGTQLWLNQAATIVVDPHFDQGVRDVQIEGEVYFKVKSMLSDNKAVPFRVKSGLQQIEVLGTSFLVNADGAEKQEVTLIEGKVKLNHRFFESSIMLQPDQKATVSKGNARIAVTQATQVHKIEAWRKGLFSFEEENLVDVIGELADWYKVAITVDPAVRQQQYSGIISRYRDIKEVFRLIELTNNIRIIEKGGKIYVMPMESK
ncbi:FecR family protein [Sphingobacterium tabacisoli]|uniref:FecR family protein n=1 Tax=Sphingobacterium tabacisoli TaxID=2044855 RepID=A0ABW5L190_9SPHI|nr:FecR domain-containing protein [Sphingobacterium tabacisoli]